MFVRFGTYDSIFTERFEFSPAGSGGHSGSGSYYVDNGSRFIHAEHSYSIGNTTSGHVRVTESKFNVFQDEIASTTPSSPDLRILDLNTNPTIIQAGTSFSNVDFILHNSSSATWNGTISVDLYLSTDDFISTGDVYLQTRTWTGSLTPNGSIVINNTSGPPSIASSTANGNYYVGGIITTTDSDTSNNFTVADDTQPIFVLAANDPPPNDDWSNTIGIFGVLPTNVSGSNIDATTQTDEQQLGSTGSTVWWFVDAPEDGVITIDTFGSDYDTQLHIYTGFELGFPNLIPVVDNDDAPGGGLHSEASFAAIANQCYEIRVGGYMLNPPAAQGNIQLNIAFEADEILLGDVNCDGVVNLLDVAPFIDLISTGQFSAKADFTSDGIVNLLDVAPFVAALTGN